MTLAVLMLVQQNTLQTDILSPPPEAEISLEMATRRTIQNYDQKVGEVDFLNLNYPSSISGSALILSAFPN